MSDSGGQSRLNARLAALAATPASRSAPATINRIEEVRSVSREKVFRFARLILPGAATVNCVVLDLSQSGARVQVDGFGASLPEYVTLEFEASGVSRKARVAWERQHLAGLSFLDGSRRTFGTKLSPAAPMMSHPPMNESPTGTE